MPTDTAAVKKQFRWYIITPEYKVVIPVLDFGIGPEEPTRDVVEVAAATRREALAKGLKELKKIQHGWVNWYRDTEANPFTGLRAERADLHGGLMWVEPNPYGFSSFAHAFGGSVDMPMGEPFDPK